MSEGRGGCQMCYDEIRDAGEIADPPESGSHLCDMHRYRVRADFLRDWAKHHQEICGCDYLFCRHPFMTEDEEDRAKTERRERAETLKRKLQEGRWGA